MLKLTGTTYRDLLEPAMRITSQEEADYYWELLVSYQMGALMGIEHIRYAEGECRQKAEENTRINLGYYAGYFDKEVQERVNHLFKTTHPIFGI